MSVTRTVLGTAKRKLRVLKRGLLGMSLVTLPLLGACADDGLATLKVALSVEGQQSFQLYVFKGAPGADLKGATAFESGCQERRSTVLELSDLPVSTDYSIVYKAYADKACSGSPLAFGFRGGIELGKGDALYVHVPVYATGTGTLLPVDLNLSSLGATPTASCDEPSVCGDAATSMCLNSGNNAWCVPLCRATADCASLHPEAVCDLETNWCMLESPWPLNASEPRLMARAMTRPNGDVVVVGGLTPTSAGGLGITKFPIERFDAATGIFASYDLAGFDGRPGASFGFAQLGADTAVVAGGLKAATGVGATGAILGEQRANGVDRAFVIDFATGRAVSASLDRVAIDPAVFVIDAAKFWVVGGHEGRADPVAGAKATSLCTLAASGDLSCAAGPSLVTARVAPAVMCAVEAGGICTRALVFGGNSAGGPVAELVQLVGDTPIIPVVAGTDLPAVVLKPVFCGSQLVGGATPGGALSSFQLDLSALAEGVVDVVAPASATVRVPASAGHAADGCGLVAGGLDLTDASGKGAWTATDSTFIAEAGVLGTARLGAAVGRIGAGPLAGSWLVLGGLGLDVGVNVVKGAEVWRP